MNKRRRGQCLSRAVGVGLLLWVAAAGQCWGQQEGPGRLAADCLAIQVTRAGLQSVIGFMDERQDVFLTDNTAADQLPGREQRTIARQTFERFFDHIIQLDALGARHAEIYHAERGRKNKGEPFLLSHAAFLAGYRYSLAFIERAERNPAMHVLLNEPMPELGLDKNSYALLKYRFLNVIRGAEFARLQVLYKYYGIKDDHPLKGGMEEDMAAIWQAGRGTGPALTAKNAGRIVADLGFTAWFPVQKGVSRLMGNTKVWRPGRTLITPEQIAQLEKRLEPGDILLERREWYATNVGIPGFWPHAALYIGSAAERQAYFDEPAVREWLVEQGAADGRLESLLAGRYPAAHEKSRSILEDGHLPRVVEAIEEGVSFTTLEHSAAADSLVVLRPRLPKSAKARAILRSFHYAGRPYDFNFDFLTDAALVCSELVYKAYEKTDRHPGLTLPTNQVLGRQLLSPNDIARLFAEENQGNNRQLDFVAFLDGNESKGTAEARELDAFLGSWQRPKWHIWIQNFEKHASAGQGH